MNQPQSILIIDDEPAIRRLLRIALEECGYKLFEAETGREGLVAVSQRRPDLVILDLGLPDIDGLEVLKRLREWTDVPVIILTVRDDPEEKVSALDSGADDFITKPFHTGELLARVRSICKRLRPSEHASVVKSGALCIDLLDRKVSSAGVIVDLTPIEYNIIQMLARNCGKIVTKSLMQRQIWGNSLAGDEHLRVHMASVRKKLRSHACDNLIQTETGVGYRLLTD